MIIVRLDRDLMTERLYRTISALPLEADEARKNILEIIQIVANAPVDSNKAQYPRMGVTRG